MRHFVDTAFSSQRHLVEHDISSKFRRIRRTGLNLAEKAKTMIFPKIRYFIYIFCIWALSECTLQSIKAGIEVGSRPCLFYMEFKENTCILVHNEFISLKKKVL